jgi:uncharacterized protein involved in tellurium resistance
MKALVSIDKNSYEQAEVFSRISGMPRSRLYSVAANEYVVNQSPNIITEKLNSYYDGHHQQEKDAGLKGAARRLFDKEDW